MLVQFKNRLTPRKVRETEMASYTNRLTGHLNVFVEQNIWSNGELMGFSPINVMWDGRNAPTLLCRYYNLSSMVERMAAGRLVDEIIKIQHNCVSDSRQYGGKLVRIAHEKLLVFKKEIQTALYFLAKAMNRVEAVTAVTWKAAVRRVLQAADGRDMGLMEIYGKMEPYAAARAENRNWQAKVRQVLQDERFFLRVAKGIYALKTE